MSLGQLDNFNSIHINVYCMCILVCGGILWQAGLGLQKFLKLVGVRLWISLYRVL